MHLPHEQMDIRAKRRGEGSEGGRLRGKKRAKYRCIDTHTDQLSKLKHDINSGTTDRSSK